MAPDQGLICAGFGFRAEGPLADFERALAAALAAAEVEGAALRLVCAPGFRPPRIAPWAERSGHALCFVSLAELRAEALPTLSQSPHVLSRYGVGSLAEACALLGARQLGAARRVRLLGPRASAASVTCALAISESSP